MHSLAALAGSCVLVAAAPLLVRFSPVDPTATLWLRMMIATTVLLAVCPSGSRTGTVMHRRDPVLIGLAGLLSAGDLAASHWASVETTVANTVLLMNLSPVFVAILAFMILREKPGVGQVAGYAASVTGAALMTGALQNSWHFGLGEGLALLSAFLYAAYFLIVKRLRERISALPIMLWTSGISALVLAPVAVAESNPLLPGTAMGWIPIVVMAVGVQIGGHGLMAYAMRNLPASYAAATALGRPVVAAVAAWGLFGEAMTGVQLAGGALVLCGLAVASWQPRLSMRLRRPSTTPA